MKQALYKSLRIIICFIICKMTTKAQTQGIRESMIQMSIILGLEPFCEVTPCLVKYPTVVAVLSGGLSFPRIS